MAGIKDAQKLQCVYCWISSPVDGHTTHCPHCGQPLHLTDGRRVIDVLAEASEQRAMYAAAGHDPDTAPAAAAADKVLTPRASGPTNWVTWLRIVLFLQVLAGLAQVAALIVTHAEVILPTGASAPVHASAVLFGYVVGVAIGTIILMWLLRWTVVRFLALIGAVYGVVVTSGGVHTVNPSLGSSVAWLVLGYALALLYALALAMSLFYPPPRRSSLRI